MEVTSTCWSSPRLNSPLILHSYPGQSDSFISAHIHHGVFYNAVHCSSATLGDVGINFKEEPRWIETRAVRGKELQQSVVQRLSWAPTAPRPIYVPGNPAASEFPITSQADVDLKPASVPAVDYSSSVFNDCWWSDMLQLSTFCRLKFILQYCIN